MSTDPKCRACREMTPAIDAGARALYARRRESARAADGIIRPLAWEDAPHAIRHTRRVEAAAVLNAAAPLADIIVTDA